MGNVRLHDKEFKPYLSEETIQNAIRNLASKINHDYQGKKPHFLVVLNGAFMFASDLLKNIKVDCEISFIRLSSYEGTTTTGIVKEVVGLADDMEGRDIIVVEDIIDTGNTISALDIILEKEKPNSIKYCTLLLKPEAYKKDIKIAYVALDIPNDFVVGFGLDYDELGRNLNAIYVLNNTKQMLNIVLFGPPGAGKGTQSERLQKEYSLVHLSTGDIFRRNIKEETELGKLAKSYIDQGNLVPNEVTIDMLDSEMNQHQDANGFIFDGFPRNKDQAKALDELMSKRNSSISMMLALDVEEEELKNRLAERAKFSGRPDDAKPEVIANRISVYKSETAPVKEYYQACDKFYKIDGMGSIDEITQRLYDQINALA
jgi:adenylate kinase